MFNQLYLNIPKDSPIHAWSLIPEESHAVLHILHGMMEHSERYKAFAKWMAERGVAVYAADHPGHGKSLRNEYDLGHLDIRSGWEEILEAVRLMQERIRGEHPGLPVILLGHSFGSAVARSFVQSQGKEFPMAGLILSGAMQQPSPLLRAGLALIAIQKARYGQHHRSQLMISLGHGQYAKFFAPNRSSFDWLSSVPEVVDDYVNDPLCGYACSLGYYHNFFRALLESWSCNAIKKMTSFLPVLLMSGSLDPAVRFGKDTRLLAERYAGCGMVNVRTKIFRNGRHEMLNEVNREEVWEFLREWMMKEVVSR